MLLLTDCVFPFSFYLSFSYFWISGQWAQHAAVHLASINLMTETQWEWSVWGAGNRSRVSECSRMGEYPYRTTSAVYGQKKDARRKKTSLSGTNGFGERHFPGLSRHSRNELYLGNSPVCMEDLLIVPHGFIGLHHDTGHLWSLPERLSGDYRPCQYSGRSRKVRERFCSHVFPCSMCGRWIQTKIYPEEMDLNGGRL